MVESKGKSIGVQHGNELHEAFGHVVKTKLAHLALGRFHTFAVEPK